MGSKQSPSTGAQAALEEPVSVTPSFDGSEYYRRYRAEERLPIFNRGSFSVPRVQPILPSLDKTNDRVFFGYLIVISCFIFFFELTNFSLSIDDELHFWGGSWWREWLTQGRWGTALLSGLLMPYPVFPFVPLLLAITCNAVAYVMVVRLWEPQSRSVAKFVAAPFALGFPTLIHLYSFTSINWAVGAGWMVMAIGLSSFTAASRKKKATARFAAIACFALGTSIYQSLLAFLLVIYLIQLASRIAGGSLADTRVVARDVAGFSFVVLASLVLYQLIATGAQAYFGLEPAYLDKFNNFEFTESYLSSALANTFREARTIYLGTHDLYLSRVPVVGLTIALSMLSIAHLIAKAETSIGLKCVLVAIFAAVVVVPFSLNLLSGGYMPHRTLVGLPIAIAGIVFIGSSRMSGRWRDAVLLLTAANVLVFAIASNKSFYAASLSYQHDRETAIMILDDIRDLVDLKGEGTQPILFVGHHSLRNTHLNPHVYSSTIGKSLFEWDKVNERLVAFYKIMGHHYFRPASPEERKRLRGSIPKHAWPSKQSIAYRQGVIIVNLGRR